LAPLVLAGACCLPAARAETSDTTGPEKAERPPPALQYAVAGLSTLLVLVIVCVPSRKGTD